MAYFIPFDGHDKALYEKGISIAELFPTNVTGIITGNDKVAIAPSRKELVRRMDVVRNATDEKSIIEMWGKFTTGQTAKKIQSDVVSGAYDIITNGHCKSRGHKRPRGQAEGVKFSVSMGKILL